MLIGNKAVFGIDFQPNEDFPMDLDSFYFWIKGNRFGSDQECIRIGDLAWDMMELSKDCGNRSDPKLFAMDTSQLFLHLSLGLYEGDETHEAWAIEETWARFQLVVGLGEIRKYQIFIVENEEDARILIADTSIRDFYSCVSEYKIKAGAVDRVIEKICEEINTYMSSRE